MNQWTKIPDALAEKKEGQLTQEQIAQFYQDGFLLIENYFAGADKLLESAKNDIEKMVEDNANSLYEAGKIKNTHADKDFFHRQMFLEQEYPGSGILLHKMQAVPVGLQNVWTYGPLLNLMEQLVGPNIEGHAIWNIRPKCPKVTNHDVPWHQDAAYCTAESDNEFAVSAWIPLLDTNRNNGCLQFIRGGHRAGKLAPHKGCYENTWYLWSDNNDIATLGVDPVNDCVTVEAPYKSLLIFNNLTPHRSLENTSDHIRWTLDFRWQMAGRPNGFAKPNIIFRLKDKPDLVPDWDTFNGINRHELAQSDEDKFSTTINPELWAKRWPVVHRNKHTDIWLNKSG